MVRVAVSFANCFFSFVDCYFFYFSFFYDCYYYCYCYFYSAAMVTATAATFEIATASPFFVNISMNIFSPSQRES